MGQDIFSKDAQLVGTGLSISDDGKTIAIGRGSFDDLTIVYHLNEEQEWMQLNSKNRTGAKYNSTIPVLNKLTDRNVYAIKGIQVNFGDVILDHPCTPGLRSRWERKELTDCDDVTELSYETNSSLFELLSKSSIFSYV